MQPGNAVISIHLRILPPGLYFILPHARHPPSMGVYDSLTCQNKTCARELVPATCRTPAKQRGASTAPPGHNDLTPLPARGLIHAALSPLKKSKSVGDDKDGRYLVFRLHPNSCRMTERQASKAAHKSGLCDGLIAQCETQPGRGKNPENIG